MGVTGDRIRADVALLESEIAGLITAGSTKDTKIAELTAERDALKARLALLEQPVPIPVPPVPPAPTSGAWVPPMKAIEVPYDWGTPDATLNPGASVRTAFLAGKRNIFLNPGDYGTQTLGSMPNTKIHSAYRAAKFANGAGPFVLPASGMVVGGLQVENFNTQAVLAENVSMMSSDGSQGQWFINMAAGKARNNAYSAKGHKGGIRGGTIYDCPRYGWGGGGTDNIFEDIYVNNLGFTQESTNRGVTKTAFSQRHTVRRICGHNIGWNGIWFDIQNQPALIEDIFFDGIDRDVVFLEVSYGGETQTLADWKHWRVRRVGGVNPRNVFRESELNWPTPSVVCVSATSDILIEDVYGTGWRNGVVLMNPNGHKQIIKDPAQGGIGTCDRTRLGIQNITIVRQNTPGTKLSVAAIVGSAHTQWPEMKQPTGIKWVDPKWVSTDKFRDFSGDVTQTQFRGKYT